MKIGGFGRIHDYEAMSDAGFDFAELDLPELEALSESEFQMVCNLVKSKGTPVITGSRLFPINERAFFNEDFDLESQREYLENVCKRANALGIKKLILGNGKARSTKIDDSQKQNDVFVRLLRMIADIALGYNLELILEPLGPRYSNYINTIPEAVEIIKQLERKNVFTMADLRHMVDAKEDFQDIIDYFEYIHQIHIDYPLSFPERRYPESSDDYDYRKFLDVLKEIGYQDIMTVEADIPDDWNLAYQKINMICSDLKDSEGKDRN